MTQIVLDSALRDKLQNAEGSVEFLDEAGNVVGVFCKLSPVLPPPYDPSWIPSMSAEEEDRRAAQPGKYSTAEVLSHLQSL